MGLSILSHTEIEPNGTGDQFLDEFLPEVSFEAAEALLEMKKSGLLQRMITKFSERMPSRLPGRSSRMYVGLEDKQWSKFLAVIEAVAIEDTSYSRVRELVRISDEAREQLGEQGFSR